MEAAIRTLWKDIVQQTEELNQNRTSLQGDILASSMTSMQDWNNLSKILVEEGEASAEDSRDIQGGSEEFFEDEGQSSEWLDASQAMQSGSAEDKDFRHWKAAAAAYSSLVDDVLEICNDNRPDMSVQVVTLVDGWQRKQVENPEVAGKEDLLTEMAETTRNLIKSQRQKKFTKSSLKCLFEQAWEQKLQETAKERTPWTNCEILYRRRGTAADHVTVEFQRSTPTCQKGCPGCPRPN